MGSFHGLCCTVLGLGAWEQLPHVWAWTWWHWGRASLRVPSCPVPSRPILSRLVLSHGHEAAGAGAVLLWHVSCQPAVPPALGQCPGVPGGASKGIPGRVGRGSPARSLAPASTQVLISTTQEKPARAQNYVRREPEGNRAPGWAALTLPSPDVLYNWEIIGCLHHKARDSSARLQPRGRRPPAPSASATGPKFSRCHPKAEPGGAGGDRHPAPCCRLPSWAGRAPGPPQISAAAVAATLPLGLQISSGADSEVKPRGEQPERSTARGQGEGRGHGAAGAQGGCSFSPSTQRAAASWPWHTEIKISAADVPEQHKARSRCGAAELGFACCCLEAPVAT